MRTRFALTGLGLLLLTACRIEFDVATEVNDDGSGSVAVTLMLGQTVRETLSEGGLVTDDPEEMRRILEEEGADALHAPDLGNPVDLLEDGVPAGWTHERLKDGNLEGMRVSAEFAALEELPALIESLSTWGDDVVARTGRDIADLGVAVLTRGFSITRDGAIFRFSAEPDAAAYEGAEGGANRLRAVLTLSVKLPGGIREHNADEERDGALVWEIPPGETRSLTAVSDLNYDTSSEFPFLPVALGGVGVAAAGGWWALRRRASVGIEPPPEEALEDAPVPV